MNGKLSSNESAMSLTRIITNENGTCVGAVRYIVSMEQVNTAIVLVSAAVIACGLVIIALVILSGLMFIRSIVTPIRKLSEISSKIAHGDFSQAKKIEYKYDDEIGDLCDAISDMALDLQTADQMKTILFHEYHTSCVLRLRRLRAGLKQCSFPKEESLTAKPLTVVWELLSAKAHALQAL